MKKIFFKFLKYTGIGIGSLLLLMFILPYIFPGFVSNKIKNWANKSIESKLNFSKARLSFFNHFPSLTLTLYDVNLNGSEPFKQDTLIAAKEIALGVNLSSIFSKTVKIDEIYVTNGKIKILVNNLGSPNYNIYKSNSNTEKHSQHHEESEAALKLDRIQIENCALVYNDQSIPILINANNLNYLGKGDLSKEIFDLKSNIEVAGFDFIYDNNEYLSNKNLQAQLITRINTHSLELDFQKNNLIINHLPVELTGKFNFLSNGYDLDFNVQTPKTDLKNLFTALPPAFVNWVNRTNVSGKTALNVALKGNYIKSLNQAPDLKCNLEINNGAFSTTSLNEPIKDIFFKVKIDLPGLNTENISIKIDTINAILGKNYIRGSFESNGMVKPMVKGLMQVDLNLEKWNTILQLDSIAGLSLKGQLNTKASFNGTYNLQKNEIPITQASIAWSNGLLKTKHYPNSISNINIHTDIHSSTNNTKDVVINIKPISFLFEEQPITIKAYVKNLTNLEYNITSNGNINIGKLYKLFAIDGYNLNGIIKTNFSLQGTQADALAGRYDKLKNNGTFNLQNINLKTPFFNSDFTIATGNFYFNNDKLITKDLKINYLNNSAEIKGSFNNIINYLTKPNEPLKAELFLKSNYLNVQDFMSLTPDSVVKTPNISSINSSTKNTKGVVLLPTNIHFKFNSFIKTINYKSLLLHHFTTNTYLQNGSLIINNADFNVLESDVKMKANYSPINTQKAYFSYSVSAKDLDIQKAYKQVQLFRDMFTTANKVKGLVSINYTINGLLNDSLYPILPTLKGFGTVSIKNAKVYGFKMINAISKKTKKEAIQNPDLSKHTIQLKTKIANNIITIEKIKLRIAGFRPKFEGQISLDGKLNLKARLGLPPFGIFGIPLTITGTQDNPIIKFKRGKKANELEETDADEEDKKDAADAENKEKQIIIEKQ
jgi:AsmA protein